MIALKGDSPRTPIQRQDYAPPAWWIETVVMRFELEPDDTRVTTTLRLHRNPDAELGTALQLHGVDLKTETVALDGRRLGPDQYRIDGELLVVDALPARCVLTTQVRIDPSRNTALEGLYRSGASLLTQCEAEGFRKITWFLDRPDVMAVYRVRLEADRQQFPVLLANGNRVDAGELDDGRHYVVWDDPFPKPSYLFALVAGDLGSIEDRYRTASGRELALKIYSEHDNLGQLDHAMDSLKRAMLWDEQRFGLEYDLDAYHIVATHDFNMGAMENKGLNIFNARYVLAESETATDADFDAIESVIAHEYFHNWTGNRVTCRDWFQLTLKEGLTVFRDQEFSSDTHSRAVQRIRDVRDLMARQWPEDAGPMAHPVRPERYVEINNFYTATVYQKGAEVVRMYHSLLGQDGFRRGMDLYFQRHDGQAVTCDDFRRAMADANAVDFEQFERWYRQVGTPTLKVESEYDEARGEFTVRIEQQLSSHPDNQSTGALHIPIRLGLLGQDGSSLSVPLQPDGVPAEAHLFELCEASAELRFQGLTERPVLSLLRGYSAPVRLRYAADDSDLACLLAHDPDAVARWLAGRELSTRVLRRAIGESIGESIENAPQAEPVPGLLLEAWRGVLARAEDDPALAAELLQLPSEVELARDFEPVPVERIHIARRQLRQLLVTPLAEQLEHLVERMRQQGPWRFEAGQVAARELANTALGLLVAAGPDSARQRAAQRYHDADNMTDRYAALAMLVHAGAPQAEALLEEFAQRHADRPLVLDKWFAVQAQVARPETLDRVEALMAHPAFSLKNPNKVRALIGTFATLNPTAFHRADGAGYRLVGRVVRELDALNPQVASRLVGVFNRWRAYDADRQAAMRAELEGILARPGLSPDVEEIVRAALRQAP